MPKTFTAKLLIVDDEAALMKALCDTLEDEGYATTGFTSAREALGVLRQQEFDLVLTDLMMPEMDGITLLREAQEVDRNLVGILMTGHGTIDTAVDAMKAGALDYILKPFKLAAILPVLSRALAVRRLRTENIQLRESMAIYELSMAITFAFNSETVLQKVADAAFQQSEGGDVSILLLAPDDKDLFVAAARGPNAAHIQDMRVPVNDSLREWVARSHEALSQPDGENAVHPASNHLLHDITHGISLPMLAGGNLVGILNFAPAGMTRPVALGQLKALEILAGAAASALEATSLLQQLRAAEKRYRRLAENAPDIVFRYEILPQRRYAYVSPIVAAITGYNAEDFYADPNLGLKLVHSDDRALVETATSDDSGNVSTTTLRWLHKEGPVIWIEQRSVVVKDDVGHVTAIEGIARDITERKKAEQAIRQLNEELEGRVRERTAELEAANKELEAFSYSISHDLRAPLRAINGFSQMILEDHGPQLPEEARPLLRRVSSNAEHMAQLIDDLLDFSRLGRQLLTKRSVKLASLVGQVVDDLREERNDRQIEVHIGDLPDCVADPSLLKQVFVNLLSNAFKFTREKEQAIIQVGYRDQENELVLMIQDNGAGFDMTYAPKLFGVFQRLHGPDEFEGTGIGLSIVKRIIHRHGGKTWAEGKPGEGATFYFSLPKIAVGSDSSVS